MGMSAAVVLPQWSPELPEVLDRLGPAWTRIDHVPFGATVDVEHVLLSPFGLAVVTTLGSVPETQDPIHEARWRARKVTALLGRVAWVPARAILVVPGLGELGYGLRDGVLVAQAEDAVCWLAHPAWSTPMIDAADVGEMLDTIVRHVQRTDEIVAAYRPSPFPSYLPSYRR
jgi:hypothetical protein